MSKYIVHDTVTAIAESDATGEISIGANSVSEIAIEEGNKMTKLRDQAALDKMSSYAHDTIKQYVNGPFGCSRIVNIGTALSHWLERAK